MNRIKAVVFVLIYVTLFTFSTSIAEDAPRIWVYGEKSLDSNADYSYKAFRQNGTVLEYSNLSKQNYKLLVTRYSPFTNITKMSKLFSTRIEKENVYPSKMDDGFNIITNNYIAKYNEKGKRLWLKKTSIKNFDPIDFVEMAGGGYMALMGTPRNISGNAKTYLYCFDSNLKTKWVRSFNSYSEGGVRESALYPQQDGSVILTYRYHSASENGRIKISIAKYNASGVRTWQKLIGDEYFSYAPAVTLGTKGEIALSYLSSYDRDDDSPSINALLLSQGGNEIKKFWEEYGGFIPDPDGGFLCSRMRGRIEKFADHHAQLVKMDRNGEVLWTKDFPDYYSLSIHPFYNGLCYAEGEKFIRGYDNAIFPHRSDSVKLTMRTAPKAKAKTNDFKLSSNTVSLGKTVRFSGKILPNGGTLKRVFINISGADMRYVERQYNFADMDTQSTYTLNQKMFAPIKTGTGLLKNRGTYYIKLYAQNKGNFATLLKEVKLTVK